MNNGDGFRIATWNIAGGHPTRSLGQFDYLDEDLSYFAGELARLRPDIVGLQESHSNDGRTLANELAERLGLPYVFNTPNSASHIDDAYRLSLAIMTRFPIGLASYIAFPNPDFPLSWPNGEQATTVHEKGLQVATVEGFQIGNTQLFPLGLWNRTYFEPDAATFANGIAGVFELYGKPPLLLVGDFNLDDPSALIQSIVARVGLEDALANVPRTAPGSKRRPDHIFYSSEFTCTRAQVVETNTDHFLCFADVVLQTGAASVADQPS